MAFKTLTSANSILIIGVAGLFNAPQQIQGFATDDIFSIEDIDTVETAMGVDGKLSAGWVPVPIKQKITLQADSDSTFIFEQWYQQQQLAKETLIASGSIFLPSVQRKYLMTRGFLTSVNVAPTAKKILQPRAYTITWQSVSAAPF